MKMKKNIFPEVIYVTHEFDKPDEGYLLAWEDHREPEDGKVAIYKLDRVAVKSTESIYKDNK